MIIDSYESYKKFISEKHDNKPTLLLHWCCAPCSSQVLAVLKDAFSITMFYYNPNIHPYEEYLKRRDEFAKLGDFPLVEGPYDPENYYQTIKGLENIREGGARCFACYRLRLEKTAEMAKKLNVDFFTTTLSISPYKNSDKINEIGQELAKKYDVPFLYSNFKKNEGYKRSIVLSKELGLYRQEYCGCIFSYNDMKAKKE